MVDQTPSSAQEWAVGLCIVGIIAVLAAPFVTRYHVRRTGLNGRGARVTMANLFYNGVATILAGLLNAFGLGIGAWTLLMSVPLVTLGVSAILTRRHYRA